MLPDFGKELDVVDVGCSSTDALRCGKNRVGGFGSELLKKAEVQSHSFAPALPELGVWTWYRCML